MHASLTDEEREYIDKVLAEAKMNYLEVEKNEDNQDSVEEENKEETSCTSRVRSVHCGVSSRGRSVVGSSSAA